MTVHASVIVWLSLFATLATSHASGQTGSEPSPMETFANGRGVHTTWSRELARWERANNRMVITALVLESDTPTVRKIHGVKIELSSPNDNERIYLDEQALERTRAALHAISDMVGASEVPGDHSCMGAMQFTDKYDWPWNKYHELNVDYCGGQKNAALYLSARGRRPSFPFTGKRPNDLAEILAAATEQLKQH